MIVDGLDGLDGNEEERVFGQDESELNPRLQSILEVLLSLLSLP